ncbi:tumor necrosis factor ligand superfamily member 14-like [Leptodactylus fuscus]|uniref:tumor necrosis factor ligand superfamily member 14-like n=1 Tax=Leptodactylus fuscus TaxID=238119 RepID=UPI003F4E6352
MDRYGQPPMSVFSVEDHGQSAAPWPPKVKKKSDKSLVLIQMVLVAFSLLALCGAASEIYILKQVEAKLRATQDMMRDNVTAQKIISRKGLRDGPPMPSAHVTGLVVDSSSNSPLQWEHSRGLAFLHEVEYRNGSLVCPKTGLYFIYSKLQMGLAKCPPNAKNVFFTHRIFKRSSNFNIPMTEDVGRFCDTQGSVVWRGNSFVAGSFMLAKGDEVYVSMSEKHLIRVQGDTATFFGMFMVGNAKKE